MNSGQTSERVYEGLKQRLMSGEFHPGGRLDPATLAASLNSSVTPVRDALHRLLGERMIETHTSTGFYVAALYEPHLRDLYSWNANLLVEAMRWWPVAITAPPAISGDGLAATRALFRHFGALAENREIVEAIEAASDRLGAVRMVEPRVIGDTRSEVVAIQEKFAHGRGAVGREIRAYHRRRLAAVPALVIALHRAR